MNDRRRVGWLTLGLVMICGLPTCADQFEFVVIGDTRPRFESESFLPFESLIGKINASKGAFVINLGDLIYGYGPLSKEKQWDKYLAAIKNIRLPYYQLPGNHDTHSKEARKVYGRRFGKFYQSFDQGDCHFVLLDNTEEERWGYLGPAQLNWLQQDLQQSRARAVFVFLHFPVWEPDRFTPEYYEFWAQTLHPLFRKSRVQAVFGGHYHTYGPTREFDGIRYYITGGGGAELRPEYKKAGGEFHFMKVTVSGERFDVRVVTEHGELTDPEADVMGGLQFASRHVSRIGIKSHGADLGTGVTFTVSVQNPYPQPMTGAAAWLMDTSACSVEPTRVAIDIPAATRRQYVFNLKALEPTATLQSLPRLEFDIVSVGRRHRFHREVRLVEETQTPYRALAPKLDGRLADWEGIPVLKLKGQSGPEAELRSVYDAKALYLAVCVPVFDADEAKELGFTDELQIGFSRSLTDSDFGADLLRLGCNSNATEPKDRTPGHKPASLLSGTKLAAVTTNGQTCYEIAVPLRQLKPLNPGPGNPIVLDLSFLTPEPGSDAKESSEPNPNTFSYRVRYGSDSLVPVHFVQLNLQRPRN